MSDLPSRDEIIELLQYDQDTGMFRWRKSNGGRAKAGATVGCPTAAGYLRVRVYGRLFYLHRLAWLCATGDWPSGHIDHINGDRTDNRLSNLRETNEQENAWNRQKQTNNTSGFTGVTYNKANDRWIAQIKDCGVPVYLGSFKNKTDAAFAYETYATKLRGEFHKGTT